MIPAALPWCTGCGRDLVNRACPHCDRPVKKARGMEGRGMANLTARLIECIRRNPGSTKFDLAEFLEVAEESRDALGQRLAELVRSERIRNERVSGRWLYYPVRKR